MKINYNVSAMIANNALTLNDNKLADSLQKLSSGMKIANAKDNPSGLAMARKMNAQIESLKTAGDNYVKHPNRCISYRQTRIHRGSGCPV